MLRKLARMLGRTNGAPAAAEFFLVKWSSILNCSEDQLNACAERLGSSTVLDLFHEFPRHGAPAGEFERALALVEALEPADAAKKLSLLWPIWSRIDELHIARSCIIACVRDLTWATNSNARAVAARIGRTYLAFPELELASPRASLVTMLLAARTPETALHLCTLACLVDDQDVGALEQLILELTRLKQFDWIERLMLERLRRPGGDVFLAEVLRTFGDGSTSGATPLLRLAMNHIQQPHSLAAQGLGLPIARALLKGKPSEVVGLNLAAAMVRAGNLIGTHWPTNARSSAPGVDLKHLIQRVDRKIRASLPQMPVRDTPPRQETTSERSEIVHWVHYRLERGDGTTEIDCMRLLTQYASRREDGTLAASQHPPGPLFQMGPGIPLPPGRFSVVFLGTADPNIMFELEVTSRNRRQIFSKNMVTAGKLQRDELGTLAFSLSREELGIEFVIRVQSSLGALTSRGIRITRHEAFDGTTPPLHDGRQRGARSLSEDPAARPVGG